MSSKAPTDHEYMQIKIAALKKQNEILQAKIENSTKIKEMYASVKAVVAPMYRETLEGLVKSLVKTLEKQQTIYKNNEIVLGYLPKE